MGRRDGESERTLHRTVAGRIQRCIVVVARVLSLLFSSASDQGTSFDPPWKCDSPGRLAEPSAKLWIESIELAEIRTDRFEPRQCGRRVELDGHRGFGTLGLLLFSGFSGSTFHSAAESSISSPLESRFRPALAQQDQAIAPARPTPAEAKRSAIKDRQEPQQGNENIMDIDPRDRNAILAHYYRAMVGRADIWRMRMDTTTNWAIGATAAVVSFALGNAATPHFVVYIAVLLTASFLFLEARRLTFYHLWQQRVLLLEKGFIRSALQPPSESKASNEIDLEAALADHLGRTVPNMPIAKATARRLRRIYLYLFGVQLLAWVLKLSSQPTPASSFGEFISRADVAFIPGEIFFLFSGLGFLAVAAFAVLHGGIDRDPI
jgi:uncharacterized membrane protein